MRKLYLLLGCILILFGQSFAQSRAVTGNVVDSSGAPVAGASITIKGSKRGTTSDADGSFKISVPANAKALVISGVNLTPQEVSIEGRTEIGTVRLVNVNKSLDEVVVVAYGTSKKTNVTGSISTINGSALADKPFTSVDKALQGQVAGLQSVSFSGAPGAATDIRIRGIGSISASANPLWVIDGVVAATGDMTVNTTTANVLTSLNPDDIESITVLKDAAATSVYGSKAANGVILVTTKKGKAGKTHLNFSSEAGGNTIAYMPKNKPMTTKQYQGVMQDGLINGGYANDTAEANALITDPNFLGIFPGYDKVNTNWLHEVTRTGSQQQYNLSLTGGNDKTTFYASTGYFKQEGIVIASDFTRWNGALNINHKANDWINFSANLTGASSLQNTPTNGGTFANPVLASYFLLPFYTPRNPDGTLRYGDNDALNEFPQNGGPYNPVANSALSSSQNRQTTFRGNVVGEFKLMNNLKFTSRFASEYINTSEDSYLSPLYGDGYALSGSATSVYTRLFDWTWSNFLDFRQDVGANKDMFFDLKVGYEAQLSDLYTLQATGNNFPATPALKWLASTSTPVSAFAVPTSNSTNSVFAIGDFNYKNRYVISGSFRRDGSSVFGAKHRWGNFYSVGGTWNINEEDFLKKSDIISTLKIRASYGENGNALGFGNYTSLATFGSGGNYAGNPGLALNNVGDSVLTWEKNKIANVALDFGLLKERITGTVEYYNRTTSNLLSFVPFSPTVGIGGQNQNIGSVVNKGIEVTLSGKPVVTRDFMWTISFNFAHNINKVKSLYKNAPVPAGVFNYTVGYALQTFYFRQWAGVNPADGTPLWYTDATLKATTGNYDDAAQILRFSADPKYYGGLSNTLQYKSIGLDFQFYYNYGNYIYDLWGSYTSSDGAYLYNLNQMSDQLNSWKKAGDKAYAPQVLPGGNNNAYKASTRQLYKGDYIRLRNIQLSYSLSPETLQKIHITSAMIYLRGTNLATFGVDKHLPYDPEAGISSTTNLDITMPKTFAVGLKIGL